MSHLSYHLTLLCFRLSFFKGFIWPYMYISISTNLLAFCTHFFGYVFSWEKVPFLCFQFPGYVWGLLSKDPFTLNSIQFDRDMNSLWNFTSLILKGKNWFKLIKWHKQVNAWVKIHPRRIHVYTVMHASMLFFVLVWHIVQRLWTWIFQCHFSSVSVILSLKGMYPTLEVLEVSLVA